MVTMMHDDTNIENMALSLLQEISREANGKWTGSKFELIRQIQIDKRGSFGERFFHRILFHIYNRRIIVEYKDGDPGDWDLSVNGIRFEIKTSSLDINNKFQNENIKDHGMYDGILFLCIAPNQLYIKFTKKEDIPFDKLHDRRRGTANNIKQKVTGAGYKWDFKINEVLAVKKY